MLVFLDVLLIHQLTAEAVSLGGPRRGVVRAVLPYSCGLIRLDLLGLLAGHNAAARSLLSLGRAAAGAFALGLDVVVEAAPVAAGLGVALMCWLAKSNLTALSLFLLLFT